MWTELGTGAVDILGRAGRAAVGAGGGGENGAAGLRATGGGEVTLLRHIGSPRVVAARGAITVGVRDVGADMGVGVEKRWISYTRLALTGTCFGPLRELPVKPTPFCCC